MKLSVVASIAGLALAGSALAQSGTNLPSAASSLGAPLLSTQANASNYGNPPSAAGQGSPGSSRLDAAWGTISGGRLKLLIAGNLEGSYNKAWIFLDDGTGGQSTLRGDNADNGFGEINGMSGMKFDAGFSPTRFIRIEHGSGFLGIRTGTLPSAAGGVGADIFTSGGTGSLPLSNVSGGSGVNFGWDNSSVTGGPGIGGVASGWNFDIDLAAFFGAAVGSVKVQAFVTNPGGNGLSNQVLNSGNSNYPGAGGFDWSSIAGNQYFEVVPAPASAALLGLGGLVAARRRRGA